jgi:hypothetical protein
VPFVLSFAGFFIALHAMEAVFLRRLFAEMQRSSPSEIVTMQIEAAQHAGARRRAVRRRQDDHRARLQQLVSSTR